MRIFIDVTSMIFSKPSTGVMRVLKELSHYLTNKTAYSVFFICWHSIKKEFLIVPFSGVGSNRKLQSLPWHDIKSGDLFLDLAWGNERKFMLSRWTEHGGSVASFIHDIIPVLKPEVTSKYAAFSSVLSYLTSHFYYVKFQLFSTEHVKKSVADIFAKAELPPPPGHVIGLGCEVSSAPEKEITLPPRPYLLFVGRLEKRKNTSLLQIIHEKLKQEFDFVFIGRWTGEEPEAEEKLKAAIASGDGAYRYENIPDAELVSWYKNAFLFLFPTWTEGFGLPVVEAMSYGTPVITSDIPEMREAGGDLCYYADPSRPDAWVNLIRKIKENPEEYSARVKSISVYRPRSWEEVGERLVLVLDSYEGKL